MVVQQSKQRARSPRARGAVASSPQDLGARRRRNRFTHLSSSCAENFAIDLKKLGAELWSKTTQ